MLRRAQKRMLLRFGRSQQGVSILPVIFVLVVLSGIGYTLTGMMANKMNTVASTSHAVKAFYLAEAGIHYAEKYLNGLSDWSLSAGETRNFGGGSFAVTFSGYSAGSPESINVTSIGSFQSGQRVLKASLER